MTEHANHPVRTGQIWRRKKDGQRVKMRNEAHPSDWVYVTLPDNPTQRSRSAAIYEWNLQSRYELESEAPE